jgi:hypothetical protein
MKTNAAKFKVSLGFVVVHASQVVGSQEQVLNRRGLSLQLVGQNVNYLK